MIISVHIPKCAGTSFRHVLERRYAAQLWGNYGAIFSRSDAVADRVPAGTRCIHGHFFADAFDDLYPQRRLMTWLRHPVERVVSNYYHCLRGPDMRDDCCRKLHEENLSLRQFAELDWMRNNASRYLAGKRLSDFTFVGVAERFAESLDVFSAIFGGDGEVRIPFANANPARLGESYTLSEADLGHLTDLNAIDLALYKLALARLDLSLHECLPHAA